MAEPIRVLFLCTGNSARSQMAEALLRHLGDGDFKVESAGTDPKGLHPRAVETMDQMGIDIRGQHSKSLDAVCDQHFDYVITVCDRARDNCPTLPGDTEAVHWRFDDPAAVDGDIETQRRAFKRVRDEIVQRLRPWITVQSRRRRDVAG